MVRLEILICPSAQWIETVVYGKVSDLVVPRCCASVRFLEVGHFVVVDGGDLVVDAYEFFKVQSCCQESPGHAEFRIDPVDCGRYVVVVINYVSGV